MALGFSSMFGNHIFILCTCACGVAFGAATTNMPPPYYAVYADAVGSPLARQMEVLSLPMRENVRANSAYINTRRYLLGPDNPLFVMTPDGCGLGEGGKISVEALELQAATSENAAEAARCRELAEWLRRGVGPSPRAKIRAKAEEAVAKAAQLSHPRVFATAADFDALKRRAESDALVRAGIARAMSAADDWIGQPAGEYRMLGYQLLVVSRQTVARLVSEAFAYRMTGDRKYADDAAKELRAVCAFPDWNPRHTIDTGEMALAVAVAYDWTFDALSPEDRETVAQALLRMGLDCEPPFAGWTRLQNNWVQVVAVGKTAAAIALADRAPRSCADHLAAVAECLPEAEAVCAPDGVYPEGPGYWNYGTGFNAIALDAMRTAFGHDFGLSEVKGFRETALYPAVVTGPSGLWFNYSDSSGSGGSSPATWWFARRLGKTAAVTDGEVRAFREACAGKGRDLARTFPFTLFWVGEDIASSKSPPPDIWVGGGEVPIGVVSGGRSDKDAAFVAIKGGSPSYNHGHADAGSFVLDLLGERWAFDLGAENYREVEKAIGPSGLWSPEPDSKRWSVFRIGSQGHNTLMIDGKGQDPRGWAPVYESQSKAGALYVKLSGVYPQAELVGRTVACGQTSARITDTVVARGGAPVRWAMNTDAEIELRGRTAILRKRGRAVKAEILSGGEAWSVGSAQPGNDWESPNPGMRQLVCETAVPPKGELMIRIEFSPAGRDVAAPRTEDRGHDGQH